MQARENNLGGADLGRKDVCGLYKLSVTEEGWAKAYLRLKARLYRYLGYVVWGYLGLGQAGAAMLFQVICNRYKKRGHHYHFQ